MNKASKLKRDEGIDANETLLPAAVTAAAPGQGGHPGEIKADAIEPGRSLHNQESELEINTLLIEVNRRLELKGRPRVSTEDLFVVVSVLEALGNIRIEGTQISSIKGER